MTMPRNVLLCCSLVMGTYVYSMENFRENEANKLLTRELADKIKIQAALHVERKDGKLHVIPQDAMDFITTNKDIQKAFLNMKKSKGTEEAEKSCTVFNDTVDSYVPRVDILF